MAISLLLAALLSVTFVDAIIPRVIRAGKPSLPKISPPDRIPVDSNGTALPPYDTVYWFDQLIDHNNPSLGTFKQRYWMTWEFYQEGGPIVLNTPGESNAEGFIGYITNLTIDGLIAQQQNGSAVMIEHRFFGKSNPYDNLTTQSLELLTVQQSIDDLVYFAQNVVLPMPGGDNVKPDTTPWVLTGGSYPGALTGWTMVNKPGVFRAGYASSAVVQATADFYAYFTPIYEYMPQNCSADVQAVVAYLDEIYAQNDTAAIQDLKDAFGLGNLSHVDDFASTLRANLFDWQELSPDMPGGQFFDFCDALEVRNNVSAPETGWGLEHAIAAWGSYWKTTYYQIFCPNQGVEECLGTYDTSQPFWTNITVDNADRSWTWLVCNELGFSEGGPPEGQPAIVSRIVQPSYMQRICTNNFPDKFSLESSLSDSARAVNDAYGGWFIDVDRLFFANGLRDPWREATVSAETLQKPSTDEQPIIMSRGYHCSDMITGIGIYEETIFRVQMTALDYMKKWLA